MRETRKMKRMERLLIKTSIQVNHYQKSTSERKILVKWSLKQPQWVTREKKGQDSIVRHVQQILINYFRFLATITVDNVQYKTYPQTYATKDEAEEAVSELAIKKLGSHPILQTQLVTNFHVGVTDLNIEPVLKVSKDLFIYTERVTDILGESIKVNKYNQI